MPDQPTRPTTIDEYLAALPPPARQRVVELRTLVRATAPDLVEAIKWGTPAFVHPDGVIMLTISGHRAHANMVFTPSTREAFATELADIETGKGSVKIPYDRATPADLLTRMIDHRLHEYRADGIRWM